MTPNIRGANGSSSELATIMLTRFLSIRALGCASFAASSCTPRPTPATTAASPIPPTPAPAISAHAKTPSVDAGRSAENRGADCKVPPLPGAAELRTNDKLPDPFTFMNGARVATKAQWRCRQAEIRAELEEYELGPKPPKPSSVTASFSDGTLTVTCSEAGKSVDFSAEISRPSGGGPFPAILVFGKPSIPIPPGVATITFDNGVIAAQQSASSRGQGKFYELYGADHPAGALIAWAWGVSRVIDALELTPAANIDTRRLAVTGCSRNGKGALVAGAFDERIALTVPQESGSGGSACWRVSDSMLAGGTHVQTLSEITGENCWFRESFSQFGASATKLPFDHHLLAGLVAPRGLLMIENTDMVWLGALSCFTCGAAAHRIWQALGVPDNMGFSQFGHPRHCEMVPEQQPELAAFITKFLLNGAADTNVLKTNGGFTLDEARWIDWSVPALR